MYIWPPIVPTKRPAPDINLDFVVILQAVACSLLSRGRPISRMRKNNGGGSVCCLSAFRGPRSEIAATRQKRPHNVIENYAGIGY